MKKMLSLKELSSPNLLYETLIGLCSNNRQYFANHSDTKSKKLCSAFGILEEQIENISPLLNDFREAAPAYDFKNVPANGYRSFIYIVDKLTYICVQICQNVSANRNSLFFQRVHYTKEIENCSQMYASLNSCFQTLQFLRMNADPGHLFLNKSDRLNDMQKCIDKVNANPFFGKLIGFQYGDSLQPVVKTIAIMMTAFAEYYYHEKNVLFCAALCSQFFANPDLRAARVAQVTSYRTATVNFCKCFWNMSESDIFKKMNVFFQPTHYVNKIIEIPLESVRCDSSNVEIPVPTAHVGLKALPVRLISAVKRQGMVEENEPNLSPPSDCLIFHLHGGGFISQTSESHQLYLKNWSVWTGVPILSVDYSLAPDAPYPRAIDEVLFAYAWALNNLQSLGTTAKRIVFAGDSAGANLCLGLMLKCIDLNLRKPDGLFLAYVPTVLQCYPSPSRLLGLLDPILSFGFMLCCLKAYTLTGRKTINAAARTDFENLTEEGISSEEGEDNESKFSETSFDSKETMSVPSFSDLSPDFEQNSTASDTAPSEAQNCEEISLPTKYRNIVRGFITNLKEKFTTNETKEELKEPVDGILGDINIESIISEAEDDIYLSPIKASDKYFKKFPATAILTVEMDPCLDDCVILAKRLDHLQRRVHLDVLKDLNHGFLNVSLSSKEAYNGSVLCAQRIKELFTGTLPTHS